MGPGVGTNDFSINVNQKTKLSSIIGYDSQMVETATRNGWPNHATEFKPNLQYIEGGGV